MVKFTISIAQPDTENCLELFENEEKKTAYCHGKQSNRNHIVVVTAISTVNSFLLMRMGSQNSSGIRQFHPISFFIWKWRETSFRGITFETSWQQLVSTTCKQLDMTLHYRYKSNCRSSRLLFCIAAAFKLKIFHCLFFFYQNFCFNFKGSKMNFKKSKCEMGLFSAFESEVKVESTPKSFFCWISTNFVSHWIFSFTERGDIDMVTLFEFLCVLLALFTNSSK